MSTFNRKRQIMEHEPSAQDEIIEMARQAGDTLNKEWLQRFAKLVAAKAIAELESQELKQVTVKDFVHIVEGKEDLIGRPVYFAQWPNGNARPPQRTWVELTEEDLKLLSAEWRIVYGAWMDDFAKEIEAKLKEKNT